MSKIHVRLCKVTKYNKHLIFVVITLIKRTRISVGKEEERQGPGTLKIRPLASTDGSRVRRETQCNKPSLETLENVWDSNKKVYVI